MEKKIAALKAAYQAKDGAKLRKAAKAVVDHDFKHPFAATCLGLEGTSIVNLAMKIVCAA